MKKFYLFSCFFTLLISIGLSIYSISFFIYHAANYIKEEDAIIKASLVISMKSELIFGLIILAIGLALTSIILLLINLNEKNKQK